MFLFSHVCMYVFIYLFNLFIFIYLPIHFILFVYLFVVNSLFFEMVSTTVKDQLTYSRHLTLHYWPVILFCTLKKQNPRTTPYNCHTYNISFPRIYNNISIIFIYVFIYLLIYYFIYLTFLFIHFLGTYFFHLFIFIYLFVCARFIFWDGVNNNQEPI